MTLASDPTAAPANDVAPVGRSLWADARARLLQNRAAVASMIFLAFLALAFSVGRLIAPHPYDQVFSDYVKAPPSLTAYPKPEQIAPAIERIATPRMALTAADAVARS